MNDIVGNPSEEMKNIQKLPLTYENMLKLCSLEDRELLSSNQEAEFLGDTLAKIFPKRENLGFIISMITDRVDKANDSQNISTILDYQMDRIIEQHREIMNLENHSL